MSPNHQVGESHNSSTHAWALRAVWLVACLAASSSRTADAATRTWNVTSGTGVWQTSGNWLTAAPADSTLTDTAYFSSGNGTQTVQFNAGRSIAGLTFAQTGSTTLASDSATARTLTIGTTGITINSGAGAVTLGDAGSQLNVAISGSQTWTNNTAPANVFALLGEITSSAASGTQRLLVTGTGATVFSGNLSNGSAGGVLSLAKSGNGTLTLSGSNTYTGTTTSSAGMLRLTSRNALYGGGTSSWNRNNFTVTGGTLALNVGGTGEFTDADVQALTTGTMFSNGNTTVLALDISNAASPFTFSGNFNNTNAGTNISFVKLGAGTLIVTGTLGTTSSTRTVASGTLQIGTATTAGSIGGVNTINNGTIVLEAQQTSLSWVVSGTGQVIKKGTGQLGVTVDQTYTGLTTIESGTLRCSDGGAVAGWLAGDVLNNGLLILNRSVNKDFVGSISGIGALRVGSTGTISLTNSNSFTGGTTIDSLARLSIGSGGTTGSITGNVTVNSTGRLIFNRSDSLSYSGTVSGGGELLKLGAGTLALSAANTYTGTTSISQGTIRVGVANALPSTSAVSLTADGSLDVSNSTSSGALTLGGTGSIFGGGTLTASSYTLSNTTGTATASAILGGTAATLTKSNAGTAVLSGLNTYRGATTVSGGVLEFNSIANTGTANASALGAPATGNGTIGFGTTADATLRYTGTGHSSDRPLNLGTGNVTIEAIGSGPIVLTGTNTDGGSGTRTFTLNATGTSLNQIGPIAGTGVSVNKTGSGLWRLTGNSSYNGQLKVLDGTIVVTGVVGTSGVSPVGTNTTDLPIIGDSAATSGTAAFLAEGVLVERGLFVAAESGSSGSQVVVLGATGTGVATFGNNSTPIRLGRSVTLQASGSATASFSAPWKDSNGNDNPVVGYTIGSAGNAGVVRLESLLSGSATGVSIVNGTAQLFGNGGEQIASATPVTVGSTLGSATLDLNGFSQSLSRLTFTGTAAGGMLRLVNSGSVAVSGTGHVISSAVALDAAASFNVAADSRITIASEISGSGGFGLTKTGVGIMNLTGTSSYTGNTTVSAGSLLVNGRLGNTAVTVQSGGLLGGSGALLGSVSVLAGGTFSPGNSPGLISTGTLSLAGATLMEIDGTVRGGSYDAVDVTGLLTYGGSMVIDFGDLITSAFANDTSFNLFDFGTYSGQFTGITTASGSSWYSGLTFASTGSGDMWTATKDSQTLEFTHSTGILVIVPEPGAIALAGIGIAAAAYAFRRRNACGSAVDRPIRGNAVSLARATGYRAPLRSRRGRTGPRWLRRRG